MFKLFICCVHDAIPSWSLGWELIFVHCRENPTTIGFLFVGERKPTYVGFLLEFTRKGRLIPGLVVFSIPIIFPIKNLVPQTIDPEVVNESIPRYISLLRVARYMCSTWKNVKS